MTKPMLTKYIPNQDEIIVNNLNFNDYGKMM